MADDSEFVDEAMQVLHALERGRSNGLSPYLFEKALMALGPGNPQICGPLKRCLHSHDDEHIRTKVLAMIAETGPGWVDLYGAPLADEVVTSIADSNPNCAAFACRAIQHWDPDGKLTTPLLLWAKRNVPSSDPVQPSQMPPVQKMIQDQPSHAAAIQEKRDLHNSHPSLDNSIRLWGKFQGMLKSAFSRSS